MRNKPTHTAYIVTDAKEGRDKKATWHTIGAVFRHSKGNGFDLMIPAGVSVSGRIVCIERNAESEETA